MKSFTQLVAILSLFVAPFAHAVVGANGCQDDNGNIIHDSNTNVLNWLHSTPKDFSKRAYVQGKIVKRYADLTNHAHFAIDLNGDGVGDLEVIYQYDAGTIPNVQPGMMVTACGDYITDPKGSPNGGIIHWIHCNSRGGDHKDGYLTINGNLYGFNPENASESCINPTPSK